MQDLKLEIANFVTIDGEAMECKTLGELWETLNIPDTMEYYEARVGIVQKLLAFHEVDLSPAYPNHTVTVRIEVK